MSKEQEDNRRVFHNRGTNEQREQQRAGFSENISNQIDDYDGFEFEDTDGLEAYLSDSVAQVSEDADMDQKQREVVGDLDFEPYDSVSSLGEDTDFEMDVQEEPRSNKWSKKKKAFVGIGTTLACLVVAVTLVVGWFMFRINYENGGNYAQTDMTPEELAAQATLPPRDENQVLLDEKIVNILCIGQESILDGEGANGRSDSMIIASMNTEDKTLKLVSLMRDSYVSIPGYRDNKLNAAFSFGGGQLLCETITRNFGIELDGYVIVDFKGFKKMIDKIGGVEIELTEAEAQYLNTTNYISDKKQRNVVPGKQTVTGTQALGYCRVRKRAAINGENNDHGRTYRQRAVLSQAYAKVKDLSITEMVSLVNDLLPYVTTNIKASDILNYAKVMLQMGVPELQQLRIPIDGAYSGQNLYCGSSLVLDFSKNNAALWEFIYGDGHGDITTLNPGSDTSYNTNSDTNSSQSVPTYVPATRVTRAPSTQVTKAPVTQTTKAPTVTAAPTVKATKKPTVTTEEPKPRETTPPRPRVTKAPVKTKEPVVKTAAPTKAPVQEPDEPSDDGSVG